MACKFEYNGIWYTEMELRDFFSEHSELHSKVDRISKTPGLDVSDTNKLNNIHLAYPAIYPTTGNEEIKDQLKEFNEEHLIKSNTELYNQKEDETGKTLPSKASRETISRIKEFLKRIGVNWSGVSTREGVQGTADILHNLIQVAEGKEDVALTEEAMHFAVEILEQTNPSLFNQMFSQISQYQLYRDTLNLYKSNYSYQTKDGKPDIRKIKKEAMGKVLAETVVRLNDGSTENPELLARTRTWWQQILDWIKHLVGKAGFNPFERASENVLFDDIGSIKDLDNSPKVKNLTSRIASKEPRSLGVMDSINSGNRREAISFVYDQLIYNYDVTVDQFLKGDKKLADDIVDYGALYFQKEEGANLNIKRDTQFNKFRTESEKMVRLEDVTNNEKYYEYEGQKIPDTVTKKVKRNSRAWNTEKTELQKQINENKQQYGIKGHIDMQDIFNRYIDPVSGIRRNKEDILPQTNPSEINPGDNRVYKALEANFIERLNTYPEGTKFMSEVMVSNKEHTLGSTLDFIAFLPDSVGAKVDILDWKFRELNTSKFKDIPFWNIEDWRKQMGEYKRIAQDYGIKEHQFRKTEMIPIITRYNREYTAVESVITSPINIKIGDELYTLPVPLEEQSTGIRGVDEYIKKLNSIYAKEKTKKVSEESRESRNRKLNALFGAIRSLQVAQNIRPLLDQAELYIASNRSIINRADEMIHAMSTNSGIYTDSQKEEISGELKDLLKDISVYDDMDVYLEDLIKNAEDEDSKKTFNKLLVVAKDIRTFKGEVNNTIEDFLREYSKEVIGKDVTSPERTLKGWSRIFRALSESTTRTLEFFYRLESPVKQKLAIISNKLAEDYKSLKERVVQYKDANGLNWSNVFDKLIEKGTNRLISRVRSEFYTEMAKAAEKADFQWFDNNLNLDEYDKWYKEAKDSNDSYLEHEFPGDGKTEVEKREYQQLLFEQRYNIKNASALSNNKLKIYFKDKWQSKEFEELHKKGNEVLLEIYNKFQELNRKYADRGLLPSQYSRRFLPFVRKTYAEKFSFGGKISVFDNFLSSISVDAEHSESGMRDPRTGQLIDRIPVFFIRDFVKDISKKSGDPTDYSKVSTDLVKNLMMYDVQLQRYDAYSEIENRAELLSIMEKAKGSLQTNAWGEVIREFSDDPENPGRPLTSKDNEKNFKLLEAQIKNRIYGHRYINEDTFDLKMGKIGSAAAKKVNKFFGVNFLPEDLGNRTISFTRLIQSANKYFGMKTMGLNIPVALTVIGGGTFQNMINSGRYFTRADYTKAFMRLSTKSFNGEDGKKAAALIDYFFPMLDNETRRKMRKVSATAIQQFSLSDKMYVLMRNFSRIVENTSFLALAENTMVKDGELVNINTYVKGLEKYHDMYKLPQEDRKKLEKDMKDEIDTLKKEKSLINGGSEIINDELVIGGIQKKESKGVYNFREFVQQISKDAVGNTTEDDMNLVRMSVLGTSFMMFKNWIPRLVDVRLGELRYTPGKNAYEWGRIRMLIDVMSKDVLHSISNIRGIITGNDRGMQLLHEMYERKLKHFAKISGQNIEDVHLDESEFIDMVRSGLKSEINELALLVSLIGIYMSIPDPDPDDDDETKGFYAFGRKSMGKVMNEISFFYSPSSLVQIANGSLFPSLGLLTDMEQIILHTGKEIYGMGFKDEEYVEKNKVWKYVFRAAPITKEMLQYIAIFNNDMAKNLGVTIQAPSLLSPQQH